MNNDSELINEEEINKAITGIENCKTDIETAIKSFNETVERLGETWKGDAATKTKNAVQEFTDLYISTYKTILENDITFLREDVLSKGYKPVEESNSQLADQWK